MADLQVLLSIAQEDYLGVPVSHDIFLKVADTTTLATLASTIQEYQVLYDGITGAKLTASTAKVDVPIAGGCKASPVSGDENEMTGLFNMHQGTSKYKYGIDVPGIKTALITNGKIDLTNANIVSWLTWLTSAHTTITVVSKFLLALGGLIDALISFRKHRKAENRRSVETA